MPYYILAIDQGTTSTRALLFDQNQHIVAIDQQEFAQYFPTPGWVEQDAEEIWQSVITVCKNVMQKAGIGANEICGLGISNQRETSIIWEKSTGKVFGRAIVWQDRRTADACELLKREGLSEWVRNKTGLLLDPYFSATKIAWMLREIPQAQQQAEDGLLAFGTIETFLVWRLTGGKAHVTDVTNASRTLLMDIDSRDWDQELLTLFDIPRVMLPDIVSNTTRVGETEKTLFGASIPITGMAGDQQAALIGQACIQKGMLKATLGSGAFLMLNTGTDFILSQHRLLSTIAYDVRGEVCYALEGSIFSAGTIVKWLRDTLQLIKTAQETEGLAQSLQENEGVYFVPAFTGLGAPYWEPEVRASISGLTRGSTKAHIVRAALEAIAYQLRDVQGAMQQDFSEPMTEMRVDGGLTSNTWLLQFIADMLHLPVLRTAHQEASAYGASLLAAVGAGCYDTLEDATKNWHAVRKFLPQLTDPERNKLYQGWLRAITRL